MMPSEASSSGTRRRPRSTRRGRVASAQPQRQQRLGPPVAAPRSDIIFPVEVWRLVFEYLYPHCHQRQFAQIVRFLPALRREAESILYTKPRILRPESASNFAASVIAAPHRAHAVRELSLSVSLMDRFHSDLYHDRIAGVLDKLPRLRSIGIASNPPLLGNVAKFNYFTLPMLLKRVPATLSLRSLRGDALDYTEQAVELLKAHPDLEEVRLLLIGPTVAQPLPSLAGVRLPKLRALAIDTFLFQEHVLSDYHMKNITHLWLTNLLDSEEVNEALDLLGPQLLSLRIEQSFWAMEERVFPTAREVHWDQCTRLRFLQVEDYVSMTVNWAPWCAKDAYLEYTPGFWAEEILRLPPALETLVWAPMWTRRYEDVGPTWKHRSLFRHYAGDLLLGHPTLQQVLYLWNDEGYRQCRLSKGHMMEGWADERDTDGDAWAQVIQ